ncbi:hypothetical protein N0V87_007525 [Didymella glomerata]|uniref:Uncharacterized protein n=1 Tax=Didymella glomerata TaxID=749621 RepID=A0A9W8WUS1_9PLEO|nr:hypothetical protein N0V87_007525 [Didymella glomerata]
MPSKKHTHGNYDPDFDPEFKADTETNKLSSELRALKLTNNDLKKKLKDERAARKQAEARLEELEADEDIVEHEYRRMENAKLKLKLRRQAEGLQIKEVKNRDLHKELKEQEEEHKSLSEDNKLLQRKLDCARQIVEKEMRLADMMNEEHEAKQAELEKTIEMLNGELHNMGIRNRTG